jgi:hypothetical protein
MDGSGEYTEQSYEEKTKRGCPPTGVVGKGVKKSSP